MAIATFLASGCCREEACIEVTGIPVTFYGYRPADLDTVEITGYAKGTGFKKATTDTSIQTTQTAYNNDTVFLLKLNSNISSGGGSLPGSALSDDHEWRIYIPALKQTVLIGNYEYLSYTCNACGAATGRRVESLSACSVNGTAVKADAVMIYK
jgi:hypothetical protein